MTPNDRYFSGFSRGDYLEMISVKMKVVKISHGSILKLVRSIGQSDRLCLRYSGEALSITVILFLDQMEPPASTVKI